MNEREGLEQLIRDLISKVDMATLLLEDKFGSRCIMELWRTHQIERCGSINEEITYELHGVGCAVHFPGLTVDFDYGENGRIDGFDVWRLYLLACELPLQYKKYTDIKALTLEFDEYIARKKVKKMSSTPGSLYVLND